MTAKRPLKQNLYLTVINSIKHTSRLPSCESLNITKQQRQYYVKNLVVDGIIKRIAYATWELQVDEYERYKFVKEVKKTPAVTMKKGKTFTSLKNRIRGHGFCFKVIVPKNDLNWKNRKKILDRKKISYKVIGTNWKGFRIVFRNHKIWLNNNSVIVYYPKDRSYFGFSAKDSKAYATYDLLKLVKGLEYLLGVSLNKNGSYAFSISRQSYARTDDELAKMYANEGKFLKVRDEKGVWYVTDKSFTFEGETVRASSSDVDMDKVVNPFLNDLKKHFDSTGETLRMSDVMKITKGISDNQAVFAKNMVSHVQAIKDLSAGVNDLRSHIGLLGKDHVIVWCEDNIKTLKDVEVHKVFIDELKPFDKEKVSKFLFDRFGGDLF